MSNSRRRLKEYHRSPSGSFPECFEKGYVLGVARRRALCSGNLLEAQEVLLGGDLEHLRVNLDSHRMLGEPHRGNWEIEQEVDPKAGPHIEEVCARRRVEAKPGARYFTIGDRRDRLAPVAQA